MIVWRGRDLLRVGESVVNAYDVTVDLTPASDGPANATKAAWAVLMPGQVVPLIGEKRYGDERQEDCY